jgi:hypothetical protein
MPQTPTKALFLGGIMKPKFGFINGVFKNLSESVDFSNQLLDNLGLDIQITYVEEVINGVLVSLTKQSEENNGPTVKAV